MEQLLNVKILDTYLPLIVPAFFGFGLNGGLFIFLFRQYYLRFPKSIEEAAHIDGRARSSPSSASPCPRRDPPSCLPGAVHRLALERLLRTLHFPHHPEKMAAAPGAADMFARLTASSTGDLTASAEATKYHAGVVMAGTVISVLPLLILYFLLQRWFMEGVERSGLVE